LEAPAAENVGSGRRYVADSPDLALAYRAQGRTEDAARARASAQALTAALAAGIADEEQRARFLAGATAVR
jgi:hypothetical protein